MSYFEKKCVLSDSVQKKKVYRQVLLGKNTKVSNSVVVDADDTAYNNMC